MNRNGLTLLAAALVAFVVALVGAAITGWSRAAWGVLIIVVVVLLAEVAVEHDRRRIARLERALGDRRRVSARRRP